MRCGSSYLVCVRYGSSGPTEAWCGVDTSSAAAGLLAKLSQAAWDPRRTEGPSGVSGC